MHEEVRIHNKIILVIMAALHFFEKFTYLKTIQHLSGIVILHPHTSVQYTTCK